MNRHHTLLSYFILEEKRALRTLPSLFLSSLLFGILLFLLLSAFSQRLYSNEETGPVPVALVADSQDTSLRFALSFLSSMSAVKENCRFELMEYEAAVEALKLHAVYAIVILPDGLLHSILDGTNLPARIILPSGNPYEAILFQTLADAGLSILSTAQTGIYTADNLLVLYGLGDSIAQVEEATNSLYLSYGLHGSDSFAQKQVSATGSLDVISYYSIWGLLLWFCSSRLVNYGYYQRYSQEKEQFLSHLGISQSAQLLVRLTAISLPDLLILTLGSLLLPVSLNLVSLAQLSLLLLGVHSFLFCFFQSQNNTAGGMLFFSLCLIVSTFLSGGFLPVAFLSSRAANIGKWMPGNYYFSALHALLTNSVNPIALAGIVGYLLLCLFLRLSFRRFL